MKKDRNKIFSWKKQIFFFFKDPYYLFSLLGHEQTKIFLLFDNYIPKIIKIFKKFRKFYFKGKNICCPCCGGQYKKFLPTGAIFRTSAYCAGCGSLERHRLMFLYLKNKTQFFTKHLKVLHIAPERFVQSVFLKMTNLEYISIDLESPFAMIKMNIKNLLFENNQFDVIICSHVLEHVDDDIKALKEMNRVLKLDGWAIIQSPVDYNREKTFEDPNITSLEERRKFFGEVNHVRIYGKDYEKRLRNAGFKVFLDNYVKTLSEKQVKRFGLDKSEIIYFCVK